jgi:hypothetical protein
MESLKEFSEAATSADTRYARELFVPLARHLEQRVERCYEESGVSEPAALSVRLAEKKYPVHVAGAELQILLIVENGGPGIAFGTEVSVEADEQLDVLRETVSLGSLSAREVQVSFPVRVRDNNGMKGPPAIFVRAEWRNAAGAVAQLEELLDLPVQSTLVDWEKARTSDPYALEPVSSEPALIGRGKILDALESMMTGPSVGSAVIRGQKRVGKTSIARTLESRLKARQDPLAIAYLEVGPYGAETISATVAALGPEICRTLASAVDPAQEIAGPHFADGSAAPLIGFIQELRRRYRSVRILLTLDEFDELPPALFGAEDLARAFFNTIRAITNQPTTGVILIGGEKMEFALGLHGDALNKFREERVDFLDLETSFSDFAQLVRVPAAEVLDVDDGAIAALHAETSGHPYFTKMICRTIWQRAVASRDAHVTSKEVAAAIDETEASAPTSSFQHFWSDGIAGSAQEQATASLERRRLLIAVAEALRGSEGATEDRIVAEAQRLGMSRGQVTALLQESVRRDVLVPTGSHAYSLRVPFFGRWLKEYGPVKIGAQIGGGEVVDALRMRAEELRVTPGEIREVSQGWGTYQGASVTAEDVRAWLDQFVGPESQRLMFKVLKGLRFYTGVRISETLTTAHAEIVKGTRERSGSPRRDEIIVSYLDGAGKSGPEIARRYRSANAIGYDNVLEFAELTNGVETMRPSAVIFVDDFVATGESVESALLQVDPRVVEYLKQEGVRAGFACVAGFDDGLKRIGRAFRGMGISARVRAGDALDDSDRCFHPKSRFFDSDEERMVAEEVALRHGKELDNRQPLGYGDVQAAVVFEARCPNNSLPILWAERGDWNPLFPRH